MIFPSAPLAATVYAAFLLLAGRFRQTPETGGALAGQSSVRERFLAQELPFGVFIGVCSLAAVFFGESIWRWYLGSFQR